MAAATVRDTGPTTVQVSDLVLVWSGQSLFGLVGWAGRLLQPCRGDAKPVTGGSEELSLVSQRGLVAWHICQITWMASSFPPSLLPSAWFAPRSCRFSVVCVCLLLCLRKEQFRLSLYRVVSMTAGSRLPIQQLFYAGKRQSASSGRTFQSIDPSTASVLAEVQEASNADVDAAIGAAREAFPSWARTPPAARARVLSRAVQLLRERNDEIARLETQDTGKAFSETSTVDVVTGADVLEFFAGLVGGGGLNGETVQLREDAWVYSKKEPLGVCAGIGAWNYPIQMQGLRQFLFVPFFFFFCVQWC